VIGVGVVIVPGVALLKRISWLPLTTPKREVARDRTAMSRTTIDAPVVPIVPTSVAAPVVRLIR